MDIVNQFKSFMRQSAKSGLNELAKLKFGQLDNQNTSNYGSRAVQDNQTRVVSPLQGQDDMLVKMQNALERVRREKPEATITDQQFYDVYQQFGDKILSELPGSKLTPTPTPVQPTAIASGLLAKTPKKFAGLIQQSAKQYGVPERLLSSLLHQESGFNPNAKSPVGALGIAQFMPGTAAGLGIDPLDPNQAIPAAAQYLKRSFDKFGSWELALAAYNAGGGAVGKYGGIPPYPETQNYVRNIMSMARGGDQ